MTNETLLSLVYALGALIFVFLLGRSAFQRSFTPEQGETYVIKFLGIHILEVRPGDPKASFLERLSFYLLFWPFDRASFIYEWAQEMTYAEYLEKVEIAKSKKEYSVSILWQPKYQADDLNAQGLPKHQTVKILVSRKERMYSIRSLEGYTLAAQFETEDGFHGYRLFTLFLEIESLSKVISKTRHWQQASSLPFKSEYNAWSKKVSYKKLRATTIAELNTTLGRSKDESFVDEINERIETSFGYSIKTVNGGDIYLDPESQDLLESQERAKKAKDAQDEAVITGQTLVITAAKKAMADKIKGQGDAAAIKAVEKAKTEVIDERTTIAVTAATELSKLAVNQLTAKFGTDGLGKLTGVYVEGSGNSDIQTVDTEKIIENILSIKIAQNTGGTS